MKRNLKITISLSAICVLLLVPLQSLPAANASFANSSEGVTAVVYDPVNKRIYATDGSTSSVKVINGATNKVIKSIHVGIMPAALAVDPVDGTVFVANMGSGTISVINKTTNSVSATVPAGFLPEAMAVDPANKRLYVANAGNTVRIVSEKTGALYGVVRVGTLPDSLAYNPERGNVYVADAGSDNLKVINGSSKAVGATFQAGRIPSALVFGYSNQTATAANPGYLYETNAASNTVDVINGTNAIVATIPTGPDSNPDSATFDSANKYVYVANTGSDSVSVVDSKSNTIVGIIPVGKLPSSIAFDSANRDIYVANQGGGTISVINGTSNTVAATITKL